MRSMFFVNVQDMDAQAIAFFERPADCTKTILQSSKDASEKSLPAAQMTRVLPVSHIDASGILQVLIAIILVGEYFSASFALISFRVSTCRSA